MRDDAVLERVVQSQHAAHALCLHADVRVLELARHRLVVLGSTNVGRKLDGRDCLIGEAALAVAAAVVEDDGSLQAQRLQ